MDNKDVLKKIKNIDGIGIIFVYIAVFTALSIACPNFLKFSNIMVGIRQAVYTAVSYTHLRKDEICGELRTGIESLLQAAEVIVLKGVARFTGVHSAVVEKDGKCQEVEFEHAIIATGSGSMPLQTGKDASLIIDSETALSSGYFPGSITIIGGGVIGMEFAFMYRCV